MFLGTFTPKILGNWQMVLPAKIRSALGSDRAIVTTGFDKCLFGFSLPEWEKIGDLELVKPLSSVEGRNVRRRIYAEAQEVDFDDQGRFVIPENLRRYAGITADLVVVGAGDHFEIWDQSEWEKIKKGLDG